MKKEHNITLSIILSFLMLSIISIIAILIIYVLYTKGENRNYSLTTYILYSLIFYKNYMPYIISLSVYLSFFKSKYLYQESISKVIAVPIAVIVLLVCFYSVYDYYFTNFFMSNLKNHNMIRDSKVYYEYELKLKNEAYERARKQMLDGNLDEAYNLAENALFYDKNDGNTLLLIKTIQEEKMKRYNSIHQNEISNINNLVNLGSREFSLSNYDAANMHFRKVLEIVKKNPLPLYYMNKISIAVNKKPLYYGNTTEEISVYGRLSETINLYESGYFWKAYDNISKLYLKAPNIAEINNYYSIIRDAISRYDFFIREAQDVRDAYIDNPYLLNSSSFNYNGINLMLGKNILLSSSSSAVFKNSLYMFDISIIEFNDELKIVRSDNFLFGKIADSYNSSNNIKNIILKVHFDKNKNEYIYNDADSRIIPINISYSTIDVIKNYAYINLKYISLPDLYTLKNEITKFGYSDKNINLEILIKDIEPITYLLLFIIISYYSFRFRLSTATEEFHLYNKVTGVVGTLLLTLVYRVFINYIGVLALILSHITIGIIIIVSLSLFLILFVIFQMARISRDVR